ncbi:MULTISPECIES: S41 family peptidase [unclassified Polaribacter]|uniref:S41 family peptidase n=1 Tax=unclassified Polaribacter TaxID=196858 RepID=UPI0011BF1E61|nr:MULTISPECIES: S41 family peptidase [unclassified Polaribacter]TXD48158.1 peptidase [Polaribacter sp. IC063]TXD55640.1 peptidase [Polaribacter sp. IC066]
MTKRLTFLLLIFTTFTSFGQSVDDDFSQKKMKKDLAVFKEIKQKVNSGLYKYRTKQQMDSIYSWAENEIKNITKYREFYNLITKLTDYEGSLHNDTSIPNKKWQNLRKEKSGYFPLPIKWIEGKWIVNIEKGEIPLGSEIISVNDILISDLISELGKFYTTDGINLTGKRLGIKAHFPRYFRLNYGLRDDFKIIYKQHNTNKSEEITIKSVSYAKYYERFNKRHSRPFDQIYYADLEPNQKYSFKQINSSSGILKVHSFGMGNETSKEHKEYAKFLDSVFTQINKSNLENLIVDVRQNGGGDDPNDLITYSYLTQRKFQENKQAWINFEKIPLLRYYNIGIPKFIRPLVVGKYNREIQEIFPLEKNEKYYQDENSDDHKIRLPNEKAFNGKIYLLVSPAVASAGSLFASMVSGNENTTVIGEETMGGYYGHNGHTPLEYKLPKSKIVTQFSIVNLEQDVPKKSNQFYNRGIIPDIEINQTYDDFLNNEDTQLNYTIKLITSE